MPSSTATATTTRIATPSSGGLPGPAATRARSARRHPNARRRWRRCRRRSRPRSEGFGQVGADGPRRDLRAGRDERRSGGVHRRIRLARAGGSDEDAGHARHGGGEHRGRRRRGSLRPPSTPGRPERRSRPRVSRRAAGPRRFPRDPRPRPRARRATAGSRGSSLRDRTSRPSGVLAASLDPWPCASADAASEAAAVQHRSRGVGSEPEGLSSRSVSITTSRRRVRSSSNSRTMTAPCRAVDAQCTCRIESPVRYSRIPR